VNDSKVAMSLDLDAFMTTAVAEQPVEVIVDDDFAELADAMLDAYRGTVDDEGEDQAGALAEVRAAAAGDYGEPLRNSWFAIRDDAGRIVSAVVCTRCKHEPFIAFVFTRADAKGRGLASTLVRTVAQQLAADGEGTLTLQVSALNPARRIYERLGFIVRPAG
jgi:predicted GNAT family acetyltransferase